MRNERRWCVHFKSVTFLERLWGDSQPQFFKEALTSVLVNFLIYLVGDVTFRKFHLEAADLLFAIKHAEQSRRNGAWLFVCVCVLVCSGTRAHASLDMQSGSLVLSEGSASIWPCPVSPAAVFQQQFVAGANMCSITAHSLRPAISTQEDQGEYREALLC